MRIAIQGASALGAFGFGREALARAFAVPPVPQNAGPKNIGPETTGGIFVLPEADTGVVSTYVPARALRQMDRFTRMALAGAFAALEDARIKPESMRDAGLVVASGYGPAQTTFAFLDSIEEYGANMASPLSFSFSVHNIPAANVALRLGMAGPCATVCQFESSVASALLTAAAWLAEGRVSRVLFGAVDEYTPVLAAATQKMIHNTPASGAYERRTLPLGEGAAFFCLSLEEAGAKAVIESVTLETTRQCPAYSPDASAETLYSGDTFYSGSLCGLPEDARKESIRRASAYGNIPVAQAFDMCAAVTLLERGETGRAICASSSPAGAASAVTLVLPGSPGA